MERSPQAHEDYLQGLRDDAYIKVASSYRDAVMPLLKIKGDFIVEKSGDGYRETMVPWNPTI